MINLSKKYPKRLFFFLIRLYRNKMMNFFTRSDCNTSKDSFRIKPKSKNVNNIDNSLKMSPNHVGNGQDPSIMISRSRSNSKNNQGSFRVNSKSQKGLYNQDPSLPPDVRDKQGYYVQDPSLMNSKAGVAYNVQDPYAANADRER